MTRADPFFSPLEHVFPFSFSSFPVPTNHVRPKERSTSRYLLSPLSRARKGYVLLCLSVSESQAPEVCPRDLLIPSLPPSLDLHQALKDAKTLEGISALRQQINDLQQRTTEASSYLPSRDIAQYQKVGVPFGSIQPHSVLSSMILFLGAARPCGCCGRSKGPGGPKKALCL